MDYEKKYKEALERARDYYKANLKLDKTDENLILEDILPELKESKDEKIRKAIYGWINTRPSLFFDDGFSKEQMLAWLEKQGKQIPADKVEPKDYSSIDPHFGKPIDKQKPKFHEGDWVVIKANGHVKQIVRIEYFASGHPQYIFSDGLWFGNGTEARLWTIQDANPGDVLASKDGDNILIFRNLDTSTSFSSYYNIARKGELGWSNECFIPATKEQRDTLMKAMADAGYIFDFEKKELKKIEQKPSWSEEDECYMNECIGAIATKDGGSFEEKRKTKHWLKSLKERVQPKQEWSEENWNYIVDLISYFDGSSLQHDTPDVISWLKSLKDRYAWKPSEEQIEALFEAHKQMPADYHIPLLSLYNDLKKLKRE